jgi:GNAT superfamily N-acetyltransferase
LRTTRDSPSGDSDEEKLRETLFGAKPAAEVMLAYYDRECAGFALFFTNYSTFLARPGIFLEDLFVKPHLRGRGIGLELFRRLAMIAIERSCGRVEWEVLDWNEPSIRFYKKLGAVPYGRMDQIPADRGGDREIGWPG